MVVGCHRLIWGSKATVYIKLVILVFIVGTTCSLNVSGFVLFSHCPVDQTWLLINKHKSIDEVIINASRCWTPNRKFIQIYFQYGVPASRCIYIYICIYKYKYIYIYMYVYTYLCIYTYIGKCIAAVDLQTGNVHL